MQKNNFSNEQLLEIFNVLANKLNVRVNRAGNIDVINPNRKNHWEHFVLYLTPNKRYLWRRWFDRSYCYPLNMKNRKEFEKITYDYLGNERTYYHYDFSKHAEFDTVTEALDYFKKYMKKYHNVNL
jgi:hypothetical protein